MRQLLLPGTTCWTQTCSLSDHRCRERIRRPRSERRQSRTHTTPWESLKGCLRARSGNPEGCRDPWDRGDLLEPLCNRILQDRNVPDSLQFDSWGLKFSFTCQRAWSSWPWQLHSPLSRSNWWRRRSTPGLQGWCRESLLGTLWLELQSSGGQSGGEEKALTF